MRFAFVLSLLTACHNRAVDQFAGQSVHEAALALAPHKPAGWLPQAGDRVLYRAERRADWQLYEVRGSPPLQLGVLRELWQAEGVQIKGVARPDDVYPFPLPAQRPPVQVTAYVACAEGPRFRYAQVRARQGDLVSVRRDDGQLADVPERACIALEGVFVNPIFPPDQAPHILALDQNMAPALATTVARDSIDLPKDAHGDVGLWPTILHDRSRVYVAYCDGYLGDVKLAQRETASAAAWDVETVDAKGAVGKYLSGAMGPEGPELAYLDQGRSVLRFARKVRGQWRVEDIAAGAGEIGIAAKVVLGPQGERDVLHYSVRFQFFLTKGVPRGDALVWTTRTIDAHAVGTFQAAVGAMFDEAGALHVSYPDQNIGDPALRVSTIAALGTTAAASMPVQRSVDDHVAAQSEIVPGADGPELLFLSHDDTLSAAPLATAAAVAPARGAATTVARHVRAFRAITLASGITGIAMAVGEGTGRDGVDGIGGGRFEFAWRTGSVWRRVVIDAHTSAQFSVTERASVNGESVVDFAYYDDETRSLKHASTQIVAPLMSKPD